MNVAMTDPRASAVRIRETVLRVTDPDTREIVLRAIVPDTREIVLRVTDPDIRGTVRKVIVPDTRGIVRKVTDQDIRVREPVVDTKASAPAVDIRDSAPAADTRVTVPREPAVDIRVSALADTRVRVAVGPAVDIRVNVPVVSEETAVPAAVRSITSSVPSPSSAETKRMRHRRISIRRRSRTARRAKSAIMRKQTRSSVATRRNR